MSGLRNGCASREVANGNKLGPTSEREIGNVHLVGAVCSVRAWVDPAAESSRREPRTLSPAAPSTFPDDVRMALKHVAKWESQSEMSAEVAARVGSVASVLVLFGYVLFLLAFDLK